MLSAASCNGYNQAVVNGTGQVTTAQRQVEPFSSVVLSTGGRLVIEQSDSTFLSVTADKNLLPYLMTEVRDETLYLEVSEEHNIRPSSKIVYRTGSSVLHAAKINGSGEVRLGPVKSDQLALDISGSGDLRAKGVTANRVALTIEGSGEAVVEEADLGALALRISGSGSVVSNGRAEHQTVSISGSGAFDGRELEGRTGSVRIEGSGNTMLNVSESLTVKVSGSGDVKYAGRPVITQQVSGSGFVGPLSSR